MGFRFLRSSAVQLITQAAILITSWFLAFAIFQANLRLDEVCELLVVLDLVKYGGKALKVSVP